jgi:hypothetical protein
MMIEEAVVKVVKDLLSLGREKDAHGDEKISRC